MEKYSNLKGITKKFLHGELQKLNMQYENQDFTIVDIVYEDESHYEFDYQMEVDNKTRDIKFLHHFCDYSREHIDLKRNSQFEIAVSKYLFGS